MAHAAGMDMEALRRDPDGVLDSFETVATQQVRNMQMMTILVKSNESSPANTADNLAVGQMQTEAMGMYARGMAETLALIKAARALDGEAKIEAVKAVVTKMTMAGEEMEREKQRQIERFAPGAGNGPPAATMHAAQQLAVMKQQALAAQQRQQAGQPAQLTPEALAAMQAYSAAQQPAGAAPAVNPEQLAAQMEAYASRAAGVGGGVMAGGGLGQLTPEQVAAVQSSQHVLEDAKAGKPQDAISGTQAVGRTLESLLGIAPGADLGNLSLAGSGGAGVAAPGPAQPPGAAPPMPVPFAEAHPDAAASLAVASPAAASPAPAAAAGVAGRARAPTPTQGANAASPAAAPPAAAGKSSPAGGYVEATAVAQKLGYWRANWKLRYFVLTGNSVSYYTNEAAVHAKPKGAFQLTASTTVAAVGPEHTRRDNSGTGAKGPIGDKKLFVLEIANAQVESGSVTPDRSFYLSFESAEDRQAWADALDNNIRFLLASSGCGACCAAAAE